MVSLAKNLKNKPTASPDDIPESLVKQCIQLIKGPPTHIYNLSLSLGVFTDEWKTAKVMPLHKKGYRYDIHNYDHLCGLVVRVSGYRYRGPGFDSRRYQIF